MKRFFKGFLTLLLTLVILAVVGVGAGLVYLTVTEYSPDDTESISVGGTSTTDVKPGDKLKVMTYSIGYAALGSSSGDSADAINSNISDIVKMSIDQFPHVNFFQQVDINSKRSYSLDEASLLSEGIFGRTNAFATDQSCSYVPVPAAELVGRVESGSLTLTRFNVDEAQRRALSDDDAWPASTYSRKPCLLVERTKLTDSTKELVLINVSFSQTDDGSIRKTQYKELCEFMQMEFAKGNYVIAGGSFASALPSVDKSKNTAQSDVFTLYEISTENLTGGWKYCTDDTTPTMRTSDLREYITDGFITSPNTIVENTRTIDTGFKYSDHNPVVTVVTLVK